MRPELRLTALAAAFAVIAAPAFAEKLTVSGITTTDLANFELSVPIIEVTDANMDEAAIRALFAGSGPDFDASLAKLSELDAAAIRIPEITFAYDVPDGTAAGAMTRATVVYRDLVLNNVADGVASGATLGGIEIAGAVDTTMTFGAITTDLLDLGAILGFYGLDGGASPDDGMKPIYRNFALEGGTLAGPGVSCTFGGGIAEEFSARPLKSNFAELMQLTGELSAAETSGTEPSPELAGKLFRFYADFLRAFSSTPMTFDGLDCSAMDPEGNGTIAIRAGAMTIGGFQPGIYPEFSFNDVAIEHSAEGFMRLGNFTWRPMDLNGPIDAILAAGDSIGEAWFEANWRKLIPVIEGFSLSDFAIDILDEATPGERIVASIGALDTLLGDYVNGVPTRVSAGGTDLKFKFPPDAVPELTALGITEPSVDYNLEVHWDEASSTIALDRFGASVDGFGGIELQGTIANAGPALFADDLDAAMQAATGLTVTELVLRIDNQGAVPALIALAAREEKQAPELTHAMILATVRALPIAVLGGTEEATGLAEALAAFFSGTPELSITLTAVDPKGIGLAELMAAQENPAVLQGKVAITATASGDPVPLSFPDLPAPDSETPAVEAPAVDAPADAPAADGPAPVGGPVPQSHVNPRTGEVPAN